MPNFSGDISPFVIALAALVTSLIQLFTSLVVLHYMTHRGGGENVRALSGLLTAVHNEQQRQQQQQQSLRSASGSYQSME